jgi:DNA-directed RNA polymerase specialized sigma24 family protein
MNGMTETQNLVRACIGEEPAAQRQLYEQYSEQMMGVCYRYTKSIHDAEDVLQEGFVKALRANWVPGSARSWYTPPLTT